jgi:hypothetical protein
MTTKVIENKPSKRIWKKIPAVEGRINYRL